MFRATWRSDAALEGALVDCAAAGGTDAAGRQVSMDGFLPSQQLICCDPAGPQKFLHQLVRE
jgi:hypothetical protein